MGGHLLHDAARVLTLRGPAGPRTGPSMAALGVLTRATVWIRDGRIQWVGAESERAGRGDDAERIDCRHKVVMPALVDAHTHLVWGGDRRDELEQRLGGADYEAIFAAGGGILSSVRQTRATDEDALVEQALTRARRMQRCGTTTFEIKSGYGLDLETELRQLRAARRLEAEHGLRIKTTCLAAHAIPAEYRGSEGKRAAFVDSICEQILPEVARAGLADFVDVFCDRGAFTVEESRRVLVRGKALGFELRVHANELGNTGGASLAAELGAASADHLIHLDDAERAALAASGTVAVLLPGTSSVLGKPYADGRALIGAGVAVAVATDCNPGSCAFENLAMVLGLSCYGNGLAPAEAICATTHNAAASLGVADRVGRVEAGLDADVLVLDTDDERDLVYHTGSPLIGQVWSRGHRLQ